MCVDARRHGLHERGAAVAASVSAAANPRVNPPPALRTSTGSPDPAETSARTGSGSSSQPGRTAVASYGGRSTSTPPPLASDLAARSLHAR